jgi:hypothetical protein
LIATLDKLRATMISVATGGPLMDEVNTEFRRLHAEAFKGLAERNIDNALPFDDLWTWQGRWSAGDLPSYQSRDLGTGEASVSAGIDAR